MGPDDLHAGRAPGRSGSGSTPPPDAPLLGRRSRRRLLVALGYGAASAVLAPIVGAGRTRPPPQPVVDLTSGEQPVPPAMADAAPAAPSTHRFDLVISGGRVIDPATGFDAVADVGIDGGIITAIQVAADAPAPLSGADSIDATGRVVAPGFVDLLSDEPDPFGIWYKLADGVTTNLAMHGVSNYGEAFFSRYEGQTPIHFGGAFHQHFMRAVEIGAGVEDPLSGVELVRFASLAEAELATGLAGVSFSPEYAPGTTTEEMVRLATLAAEAGHVAFFHVRYSDPAPPGTSLEAVAEALDVGRRSGAAVHIEHLSSTGGTHVMAEAIDLIERARAGGVDVTACLYPYDFWGTFLASSRFALGWQDRFGLTYGDLQVAGSDVMLTEASFDAALAENPLVAALGSIPEAEIEMALGRSWTMIASDAILTATLNNHPRAAGTFARTFARYVRERPVLDLVTALAKVTILPARRVEGMIPAMARKGRLQRGADADIVVFDPATIADRATVADPGQASVGIDAVVVEGVVALRDGQPQRDVRAGRALKGSLAG